jgi:NAD(P)-dependent dehydrogenase (short-subunit alcohol dehydrogenase family)
VTTGGDRQRQRVVAISGANRGIGQATARALCAAGYTVVAGVRQPPAGNPDPGRGAVHHLPLDLTDHRSIEQFAAATAEIATGSLTAAINNAGVGALGPAEEFPVQRAREVFEVNLWGAVQLTQRLLPLLRAHAAPAAPAYLLNIGSLIAEFPVPYHAVYAASKGALRAYSLALRGELAGQGVAVVLLEPGDIATRITALRSAGAGAAYRAGYAQVETARARKMAAAPPPEAVARRVIQVLATRRPPPIVACGAAAPTLRFLRRLLPDRLAQTLTLRSYGLRRRDRGGR